ncbi:hypothetical protein Q8791_03965 [Nocardiopsis sp. CT-R113]|uniref:Uncharacterized protein n=1 Tax=Nocardiopsis codii TaxID=3065942 RepID=A0ABU7K298_9ACTN|nr:hypothetical protein [Nocardiopsis sp. CT-R113]MEE2036376.1 hypothetical protein [Nocardiopsis sp. CT-R113]
MSSQTSPGILRSRMGTRTAGLLFAFTLLMGGGLVSTVATAAPAEAACRWGAATVGPSYSWGRTNTADCSYQGRSWATHGSYSAATGWTTRSSSARAADSYGSYPRVAGYAFR